MRLRADTWAVIWEILLCRVYQTMVGREIYGRYRGGLAGIHWNVVETWGGDVREI